MEEKESSMCKIFARYQHVMEPGAWDKVEVLVDLGRGVSMEKEFQGEENSWKNQTSWSRPGDQKLLQICRGYQ